MKCKNCKADNKQESICDAGVACYVLRCGEYGCALNGKTVDRLLRMKKYVTNADRIRSMSDEEFSHFLFGIQCAPASRPKEWLDWLRQEDE